MAKPNELVVDEAILDVVELVDVIHNCLTLILDKMLDKSISADGNPKSNVAVNYKGCRRKRGTEVREGGVGCKHALCGSVRISRRDTIPLTRIFVLSKLRARPASSLSKCLMSESRQHLEGDGQFGFDQAIISVRHSACVLVVLVESAAPQMVHSQTKMIISR